MREVPVGGRDDGVEPAPRRHVLMSVEAGVDVAGAQNMVSPNCSHHLLTPLQ
jgi:hypothetical protein